MNCNTYCVLADLGLATQTNGNMTICNQSRTEFKNSRGEVLRLDHHSIKDAWNSPTRQEIVTALKSGQRHKNCYDCWHEEDAGRASMRQLSNQRFSQVKPLVEQPRVFMLKPGNACNLSCRHCNPFVSTGWYRDHFHAEVKPYQQIKFVDYVRSYDSIKNSFSEDNELWSVLKQWNENIIFYDLYGAEPLLIAPLLETLRHSFQTGASTQQTIHVNTNGTIWHDDFNEVFSSFHRVELGVSIDGIDEQFEYMRHPAKWKEIFTNISKYRLLAKKNPSIDVGICITVSLLNVYYLPEYVNYFHELGFDVAINILHRPEYLNMRIAEDRVKEKIVEKLEKSTYHVEGWDVKIKDIINFVNLPYENSAHHRSEFWKFTKTFDQLRGEDYATTFDEFYRIMIDE